MEMSQKLALPDRIMSFLVDCTINLTQPIGETAIDFEYVFLHHADAIFIKL